MKGKVGQLLWHAKQWSRLAHRWLRYELRTPRRRLIAVGLAMLLGISITIPLLSAYHTSKLYALTAAENQLVGTTNGALAPKLTYDSSTNSYYFNKSGIKPDPSSNNPASVAQQLESQRIGGGNGSAAAKDLTYSAQLFADPTKGITYYDDNTGLSFTLTPQFKLQPGKEEQGRVIYPYNNDVHMVYTPKGNGLKENLVIDKPVVGNSLTFSYHLDLPDTLQAKLVPDGSGELGIYSADPSLFTATGDSTDMAKLQSAQQTAPKTNLLFVLPAPVLASSTHQLGSSNVHFSLDNSGTVLTVTADNLQTAGYPLTVDPSVVVTSTSDWETNVGESDNISYATPNEIGRQTVSGGNFGTWATTTTFPVSTGQVAATVYNGYVYVIPLSQTVYYAALNSNGTVGTWNTTTSLPSDNEAYSLNAYDGYLYSMDGASSNTYYAPINSNGTIGAWKTSTPVPSSLYWGQTTIYNGYVYETGENSTGIDYAPINANGTIGTWTATTSLPAGRTSPGFAAGGGYLYVAGGNYGATTYSTMYAAPINSNGSVGAWSSVGGPTTAEDQGFFSTNGYLYWLGGYNQNSGTSTFSVYYGLIQANGSVNWTSMANLPAGGGNILQGAVVYNNYVYNIAGEQGYNGGTKITAVYYAQINPPGDTTPYSTTAAMKTAVSEAPAVVWNGYLYVFGGNTGSACTTTVQYAQISSYGLGSWSTTMQLPNAIEATAAAVYSGTVYVLGGDNCSGTATSAVESANIGSTSPAIGAWTTQTSLPTARTGLSSVVNGNYIYALGGYDGTNYLTDVYYASLNSAGTIGTWTATTSFGTGRDFFGAQALANYLYIAGGNDGLDLGDVQYAPINSNGTIGTWATASNTFLTARAGFGFTAYDGTLYIEGGTDGSNLNDVQFASINPATGAPNAWSTSANTITARAYLASVATNGELYVFEGDGSTDVQYAQFVGGGSGDVSGWNTGTALPAARAYSPAVAYNGYLYVLGGYTGSYHADVQVAPLTATTGAVGSWTATTNLPDARQVDAFAYNGYMYIVGGADGSGLLSDVESAPINATNGTLGSWTPTTALPSAMYGEVATYNGNAYLLNNSGAIYYATIGSNGTLGSWASTTAPGTSPGAYSPLVMYDGYAYVIGGGGSNVVQVAPINSNGTIGSWTSLGAYADFNHNRTQGMGAFAYSGYLYILGGSTISGSDLMLYAPILSNGTLGAWQTTTSGGPYYGSGVGATEYNGYIYDLGGNNSSSTAVTTDQYASLLIVPRVAYYSRLVSLGSLSALSSITYAGQLSAASSVDYETAGSNGVFGSPQPVSSLAGGTASNCTSTTTSGVFYVELLVTFNDSQNMTYPDTSANASYLTDITVNYGGVTAAPSVRLRNGMYFSTDTDTEQPLSTCH